ncbi:hypothetical protein QZH41_001778 [Actinostola sp. cb2023]|nr:hypothetical protein QZH41_001778 [Actinostola sp. cb2023]
MWVVAGWVTEVKEVVDLAKSNGLKKATVDELEKNDLDILEALKLVAAEDIATLELTLGQRKLLLQAVQGLSKTKNEEKEDNQIKSEDETTPVTTKTLAKDGGLEEILKKIEGISLDDPLYTLGATEQPSLSAPLGRLDQNPQVFLGSTTQQSSKKGGKVIVSSNLQTGNDFEREAAKFNEMENTTKKVYKVMKKYGESMTESICSLGREQLSTNQNIVIGGGFKDGRRAVRVTSGFCEDIDECVKATIALDDLRQMFKAIAGIGALRRIKPCPYSSCPSSPAPTLPVPPPLSLLFLSLLPCPYSSCPSSPDPTLSVPLPLPLLFLSLFPCPYSFCPSFTAPTLPVPPPLPLLFLSLFPCHYSSCPSSPAPTLSVPLPLPLLFLSLLPCPYSSCPSSPAPALPVPLLLPLLFPIIVVRHYLLLFESGAKRVNVRNLNVLDPLILQINRF